MNTGCSYWQWQDYWLYTVCIYNLHPTQRTAVVHVGFVVALQASNSNSNFQLENTHTDLADKKQALKLVQALKYIGSLSAKEKCEEAVEIG